MARDGELYKDRIEVSLDARQIFYLFFGGSVIVGLVFVLGVMVGRRVEARGFAERAHLAATLDPLAALDRLQGDSALSFASTLRGESVVMPVDKTIDAQTAQASRIAKPGDVAASKPAVKLEAKVDAKDVKSEAKPEAKDKPEAKPEARDKPEAKPAVKDAKPAVKDPKPEAKDVKPESKGEDKPERKSRYTLQLSSFQDRAEADAFAQSVKTAGLSPYIIEGDVDGKQFYRVRIGSYRSLDAANDAKAEFEKATKKSAIITKL
jgi:cell division septation protein DedD